MKTYAEMVFPVVLTLGVGVMLVSSLLESSWITKFVPMLLLSLQCLGLLLLLGFQEGL